jgi:hypothetical protein
MASTEDDYDAIPDEFYGIDLECIPSLSRIARSDDTVRYLPPRPASSNSSSQYSGDEFDASFLAEVDALENRLNEEEIGGLQIGCKVQTQS